jgi:hypothetical protein
MDKENWEFAFFGHHKCASSWFTRLFWNIFADAGIHYSVENGLDRSSFIPAKVKVTGQRAVSGVFIHEC